MFKGRNTLKINQATMRVVVEEWLDRRLAIVGRVEVTHVSENSPGEFTVGIDGREK